MKNKKKYYFLDVSQGKLYVLPNSKVKSLLTKYPYWWHLDAEDDRLPLVKKFFEKYGKLLSEYSDENLLASYV
jgi:hypothetical protein